MSLGSKLMGDAKCQRKENFEKCAKLVQAFWQGFHDVCNLRR